MRVMDRWRLCFSLVWKGEGVHKLFCCNDDSTWPNDDDDDDNGDDGIYDVRMTDS